MKPIVFMIALLMLGYPGFSQNTSQLLDKYLSVKNALVSSDSKAAADAALAFQKTLSAEPGFSQKKALMNAAEHLAKAGGLESQRAALAELSPLLWKIVKASDTLQGEVYYDYCPMKKSYWLSTEPAIKNPYYGPAMLSCGKVAERKK